MASIFTGLAFMHGHIVNKELILALGAPERERPGGSALARDTDAGKEHRAQARSHEEAATCGGSAAACC